MWMDDETPKPLPVHVIGSDLSKLSVAELRELAELLKAEVLRVKRAASEKERTRAAADSVFKA